MGRIYPGQSAARIGCDHWLSHPPSIERQLFRGPLDKAGLTSSGFWSLLSQLLEHVACLGGWVALWFPRWCRPNSACLFYLGLLGIGYKVICRWLLIMLGLEVPRWSKAVNGGQLLLVRGLWPLSKRYGGFNVIKFNNTVVPLYSSLIHSRTHDKCQNQPDDEAFSLVGQRCDSYKL